MDFLNQVQDELVRYFIVQNAFSFARGVSFSTGFQFIADYSHYDSNFGKQYAGSLPTESAMSLINNGNAVKATFLDDIFMSGVLIGTGCDPLTAIDLNVMDNICFYLGLQCGCRVGRMLSHSSFGINAFGITWNQQKAARIDNQYEK